MFLLFPSPLPPLLLFPLSLPFPLSPFSLSSYLIFLYIGFQRRRLRGSLQCNSSHTNRTGPRPFSTRRHQLRRACERIGIRWREWYSLPSHLSLYPSLSLCLPLLYLFNFQTFIPTRTPVIRFLLLLSILLLFYFISFVTFVLFCFVLFCFVLFCFVLFCFVLFCFVLFCFVSFCFVIFALSEVKRIDKEYICNDRRVRRNRSVHWGEGVGPQRMRHLPTRRHPTRGSWGLRQHGIALSISLLLRLLLSLLFCTWHHLHVDTPQEEAVV